MKTIALITDFGLDDNFVGVIKGVIISINPQVRIIDITHNIKPFDIKEGAFLLLNSYCYFPLKTIFVAVVDPGVGSKRKAIAVKTKRYYFIGPDNGILSLACDKDGIEKIIQLTNKKLFLQSISSTFEGRDIFASVAAYFSKNVRFDSFGPRLKTLQNLELPTYRVKKNILEGYVIYIDKFGNLITNINKKQLIDFIGNKKFIAYIGNKKISQIKKFYTEGKDDNKPFFIEGGLSFLEISLNKNRACDYFKVREKAIIIINRY